MIAVPVAADYLAQLDVGILTFFSSLMFCILLSCDVSYNRMLSRPFTPQ